MASRTNLLPIIDEGYWLPLLQGLGALMLIREPTMVLRDWTSDSRRWADVPLIAGDIVVATSPKCGTTWTQRIIGMLLRNSADPFPIQDDYP